MLRSKILCAVLMVSFLLSCVPIVYAQTSFHVQAHRFGLMYLSFSQDGQILMTATVNEAKVWKFNGNSALENFATLQGDTMRDNVLLDELHSLILSPDGTKVVAGVASKLKFWDVGSNQVSSVFTHPGNLNGLNIPSTVKPISFSPDGRMMAMRSGLFLLLFDVEKKAIIRGIDGYMGGGLFSPDGKYLTFVDDEGMLIFWDTSTGDLLRVHGVTDGWAVFSADGSMMAFEVADGIMLWDVEGNGVYAIIPYPELKWSGVGSLAISPNNKILAIAAADEAKILLCDIEKREILTTIPKKMYSYLLFSPDGLLVGGDDDGVIYFWDVTSLNGESNPNPEPGQPVEPKDKLVTTWGAIKKIEE